MPLKISPSTLQERKKLFAEGLINNSNLSKISNHSVNSAIAHGVASISGKSEKDVILAFTELFPDNTFGSHLDQAADNFGVAPRFGESQSSTYLRVVAEEGTEYFANTHVFETQDGKQFNLEQDFTVGEFGFTYVKVRSNGNGADQNVDPNTITTVTPEPEGHEFVTNEYRASGGRDTESDDTFRVRIKEGGNILAKGTLAALEQAFMLTNQNVLRLKYQGVDDEARVKIAVVTQNGIDLSAGELDTLLETSERFFSFTDLRPFGTETYGVVLSNIEWQPVDVSFRVSLLDNAVAEDVLRSVQIRFQKYVDFRFWKSGEQKVEWDDLLQIVKSTRGVRYVPDQHFYPNVDVATNPDKLPRFRGFLMLDLDGNLIQNQPDTLAPAFYPQNLDFSFQQTVLQQI